MAPPVPPRGDPATPVAEPIPQPGVSEGEEPEGGFEGSAAPVPGPA